MSKATIIHIKESSKELKQLQKNQPFTIIKRLNMLLELKKNGVNGLSKRQLAKLIGVDPNSIQKWRTIYVKVGIKEICRMVELGLSKVLLLKKSIKKLNTN